MENNIKLEKTENGYFAIASERYFKINEVTYEILQAKISGRPTDEISKEFEIKSDEIEQIWDKLNSKQVKKKKISKLFLIIPSVINNSIGRLLAFLCQKYIFIMFILGFCATLCHYLFFNNFKLLYANLGIIDYLIVLFITVIIHEYGHIVTSYYRGLKNLSIYLGFFIIFPILYTKISDLVTKKFNDRLLVDFGGVYFQLIFFAILYLTGLFYQSDYIQLFLIIDLFIIIINVIPFYFTDGYWLYADIFKIENLNAKSALLFKELLHWRFNDGNFKKPAILFYMIFKIIIFGAIIAYVAVFLYSQSFYIGDTFYQIKESNGGIIVILRCLLVLLPYILLSLFIFNKIYSGYKRHH